MEVVPTKKLGQATLNCQPCYISSHYLSASNAPINVNLGWQVLWGGGGWDKGWRFDIANQHMVGTFDYRQVPRTPYLGLEAVKDLVTTRLPVALHYHRVG